jgi:hypothetical protein
MRYNLRNENGYFITDVLLDKPPEVDDIIDGTWLVLPGVWTAGMMDNNRILAGDVRVKLVGA